MTSTQISLLRQQLFDKSHQIQLLTQQNQHLLSQLAQSRQKQQSLKKLNDMLVEGMGKGQGQDQVDDKITLRIQGEFLSMRIVELEEELERYRKGVSESVDRRVKKIVGEYVEGKELEEEKQRSRLGGGNTSNGSNGSNSGSGNSGSGNGGNSNSNSNSSKISTTTTNNNNNHNNSNNTTTPPHFPHPHPNPPNHYHQTHSHKYYNIHYNTYPQPPSPTPTTSNTPSSILLNSQQSDNSIIQPYQINIRTKGICLRCQQLLTQIQEKDAIIQQLQRQLEQWVRRQEVKYGEGERYIESRENRENRENKYYELNKENKGKDNVGLYHNQRNNQLQKINEQLQQQIQHWRTNYNQLYHQYQLLLNHNPSQHPSHNTTNTQSHNTTTTNNPSPHYTITQSPISGFKKKQSYPSQLPSRQQQMLQQITNLVNGMGRGKREKDGSSVMKNDSNSNYDRRQYYYQQQQQQGCMIKNNGQNIKEMKDNNGNKSRVSYGASRVSSNSRISQQGSRLECSKFTIKEGVNRHNNNMF